MAGDAVLLVNSQLFGDCEYLGIKGFTSYEYCIWWVALIRRKVTLLTVIGILHIDGFVAFLIVLGVLAPKHDALYIFGEVSNTSGWQNDGVSWIVGLLSTVYPFLGYVVGAILVHPNNLQPQI
jgi:hypothetical protein